MALNFNSKLSLWLFLPFAFWILTFNVASAAAVINKPPVSLGLISGLVGSWSFDGPDMAGNTAYDRSGQGNNGTLTNGPVRSIGKIGQGLSFDGSDDRVDTASSVFNPSTTDFTVSVWFKADSLNTTSNPLVAQYNGTGTGRIWLEAGRSSPQHITSFLGGSLTEGTTALALGSWYHGIVTKLGTTITLYLNGAQEVTSTRTVESATGGLIFATGKTLSPLFDGLIDDVRVYNRALTQDEITRLYRVGATLKINKPNYSDSLQNGLVGSWSFDGPDMAGDVAYDRSGNANNGTLTNGPVRTIGKIGQGLQFDGVNDYVNAGDINVMDGLTSISVSAWVRHPSSLASEQHIVDKSLCNGSTGVFELLGGYSATGKAEFVIYYSGTTNGTGAGATNIDDGQWHHLIGLYNGTNIQLYVDGKLDKSIVDAGRTLMSNTANFEVGGACNLNSNLYWNGFIDDVRVYNRALTQDEITRLYRVGATLKINKPNYSDSLQNGLVGSWSFDGPDMAGDVAYDRSGNANNGTLTNGPVRTIGKIGQGLSFDGSDDRVDVAGTTVYATQNAPFSVSSWVKLNSFGSGYPAIIKLRSDTTYSWNLIFSNQSSYLGVTTGSNGGTWADLKTNTVASTLTGVWRHVVVTYNGNGSGTVSNFSIYLDGVLLSANASSDYGTTVQETRIGMANTGSNQWDGLIDDVRVYNRALSADEILRLYNTGR